MTLPWIFNEFRWTYLLLVSIVTVITWQLLIINILYPILLSAALIPGIIYVAVVRNSDVGMREPRGVLALHMTIGILLIFPAIILEGLGIEILLLLGFTPFFDYGLLSILFWSSFAVLVVAPVEEFLKWLGSIGGNLLHKENDEASDSIVYSVAVAGGFALFENYRYIFSGLETLNYTNAFILAIARSFTAIPLHLGCALLMGYYLSGYYHPDKFGIKPEEERIYLFKALIYPIIIHGIYDLIVFLIFFNFALQVTLALIFVFVLNFIVWRNIIEFRKKGQYGFVDNNL